MSGQKPREIAAQILNQAAVTGLNQSNSPIPAEVHVSQSTPLGSARSASGGQFIEDLLETALSRSPMSQPDRRLCQELVYGVVRWLSALDWLIARKTDARSQKPKLQNLLRLGLYQIFWLERIPNHAAVHETVELAKRSRFSAQAGFVNALLRGYLREFDSTKKALAELKTSQPAVGFAHPQWLVDRWQSRWSAVHAAQLLDWNNRPPKTFARVNQLKITADKLLVQWRDEDVEYDFFYQDWVEENSIFELKLHPPLARLPSFQQGLFYVQDPSTLLAVQMLAPKPGETVLDLCAAPGGKLSYIAQLMNNEGRLVGHDISPARLKLIRENCARLGITCVEPVQGNVTPLPGPFDCILVDAPCSNTGVMRRRVEVRWRIQPGEIERLTRLQSELLGRAAQLLRPGGRLVYSTCSLEPEENEGVVEQFLRTRNEFTLEQERRLLPFEHNVDGAYVAQFKRR